MTETATSHQQETVSGKRLLAALGWAILAAAVIGGITYAAFGPMSMRAQAVAFLVYATLTATLCLFFRPATKSPISLRFTGAKALVASVGIFVATVAVIVLFYYCLGSIFGSVPSVARQIVSFATDAAASRVNRRPFGSSQLLVGVSWCRSSKRCSFVACCWAGCASICGRIWLS